MTIIVDNGFLIGELSRLVGVSTQTIRYYERLGLLDPPPRTVSRYRLYSVIDQERLRFNQLPRCKQSGYEKSFTPKSAV